MKTQKLALINRHATMADVDKWMEDVLVRIELSSMHPHSVIHQDDTVSEQQTVVVESQEVLF